MKEKFCLNCKTRPINKAYTFCSRTCYLVHRHKRTHLEIICDKCGSTFIRKNCKIKSRNYCTKKCSGPINHPIGTLHTEEYKKRMSQIAKERGFGKWMNGKKGNSGTFKKGQFSKDKHPFWKGGITPLTQQIRHCEKNVKWIKDIFERDDYTCKICGSRGGKLHADHYPKMFYKIIEENNIKNIDEAINCSKFWDLNNGRTLCKECHKKVTAEELKLYWKNQVGQSIYRTQQKCTLLP